MRSFFYRIVRDGETLAEFEADSDAAADRRADRMGYMVENSEEADADSTVDVILTVS